MIKLTASKNPLIKEVRSLKNRDEREEKSLYFIEGVRFVEEALKEKADIKYAIVSETFFKNAGINSIMKNISDNRIKCYMIPDSLFSSISDTKNPQGILAVLGFERKKLNESSLNGGMLIILDKIKDPGNMGTIIRTADAAGCECIILPDGCVDIYNPKVLRSTMGSVYHIPVYHCGSVIEAADFLRIKDYRVCASHLEGSVNIYEANLTGNLALIIGSEAEGISEDAAQSSDMLVKIPMKGRAESLNASVAAGVMLFEAMRQRMLSKSNISTN